MVLEFYTHEQLGRVCFLCRKGIQGCNGYVLVRDILALSGHPRATVRELCAYDVEWLECIHAVDAFLYSLDTINLSDSIQLPERLKQPSG